MFQSSIICLTGPTATGKSALTLELSQKWPFEIINMNSVTIYRGMDIGTAKPSQYEQNQVQQHLLDICDPIQSYSIAEFYTDANHLIKKIRKRGNIPLLVGGTMFYYKALRNGLHRLPKADPVLRKNIQNHAEKYGWPNLHSKLAKRDPIIALRLSKNDSQRIQRALEVCILSGKPMSDLLLSNNNYYKDNMINYITISLEPSEKSILYNRIEKRFNKMLENGLINEVNNLYNRKDLNLCVPSMRSIGYRQIWEYLDGNISLETACKMAIMATRALAKKQTTWLRSQPERIVFDCLSKNLTGEVISAIAKIFNYSKLI